MILDVLMKQQGFIVVTAENGHEAFMLVKESLGKADLLFDLILLDINMPICNGNEACKQIIAMYNDSLVYHLKNFNPEMIN